VFVKGKSIGGCDDTHELHSQGTLIPMINWTWACE
jgi:glutaredoxin